MFIAIKSTCYATHLHNSLFSLVLCGNCVVILESACLGDSIKQVENVELILITFYIKRVVSTSKRWLKSNNSNEHTRFTTF
jgi:hypothetical protein